MNLTLEKNDRKATVLILVFSVVVFTAVTVLEKVTLNVNLGFNPHVLALVNAIINTIVAVSLCKAHIDLATPRCRGVENVAICRSRLCNVKSRTARCWKDDRLSDWLRITPCTKCTGCNNCVC